MSDKNFVDQYHSVWQQKMCVDEVSLPSTFASNFAYLFGNNAPDGPAAAAPRHGKSHEP